MLSISGCKSKTHNNINLPINNDKEADKKIFSYEKFIKIIKDIEDNYNMDSFEIIESSSNIQNMIVVEKDITYNKKQFLTNSGNDDGTGETQERIIYKNKSDFYVIFDIIFTDYYIGNNLIYYKNCSDTLKNNEIFNSFSDALISYNNIIIKVTLISNKNNDNNSIELINQQLNLLEEFLVQNHPY